MLSIVPTPIGNLGDMTFRGVEVLKDADLILCEDTRTSKKLLRHFNVETPCKSYHAFNEHKSVNGLIEQLENGRHLALITDAGMPGISDPGFLIIRACVENKIEVEVLPGASAILPAIVGSGLPCDKFYFDGFLPQKKGRKSRLEYLGNLETTVVFYESPHRILKCIKSLSEICPNRSVVIARELSKLHEEYIRGSVKQVLNILEKKAVIKGELVVILGQT